MARAQTDRRGRWRLTAGVLISLAVHAVGAAGLAGSSGAPQPPGEDLQTPPPERERVPLGIRHSDATTITWIGFEEPTPNQAPESTIEQAAQEIGGGQPAALSAASAAAAARAVERAALGALAAAERLLGELEVPALPESRDEPGNPADNQTADAKETAAQPTRPAQPGPPAPTPGNAERESQAVSIEKPVRVEWGKPIAAEGLEILTRTKGPNYTAYTRSTARPRNPLVEIAFGAGGTVKAVRVLRSSGNPDVDRPLIDALYTWRARGERVDALGQGETVKVRMRMIIEL